MSLQKFVKGSTIKQYYASFCVNLLTVGWGVSIGWSSPTIPILMSDDTPLPAGKIDGEEVSDVISTLCIGGLLANYVHAYIADKVGRKISLLLAGPVQILGWLLIYFAQTAHHLMIARFLLGWAGGPVFNILSIYVSELSEKKIRGFLGTWMILVTNIGILMGYVIGAYLSYHTLPLIMIPFSALFMITMIFLPESPQYLVQKNKIEKAEKSLKYFRNNKEEEAELQLLKNVIEKKKNSDEKLTWDDFKEKTGYKPFYFGVMLIAIEVFCGGHAMLSYTSTIFRESGSSLSPNDSSIIVGVIQILGSYASTLLVERAGRKILMCLSSVLSAMGLVVLSVYTYLKNQGYEVQSFDWIPIASFSFVIFIQNLGIISIPFVYLAEISPQKIRGFVNCFNVGMSWFYTWISIKYMHTFFDTFGMDGTMMLYAIVCFVGTLLVILFIPETKGKSVEEIIELLEK